MLIVNIEKYSLKHGLHVIHQVIEDFAGSHDGLCQLRTGVIVASHIHRHPLAVHQLLGDLGLSVLQAHRQTPPGRVSGSEGLRPVESQVVVTAAVVQLAHLPARGLVPLQPDTNSFHQSVSQESGLGWEYNTHIL